MRLSRLRYESQSQFSTVEAMSPPSAQNKVFLKGQGRSRKPCRRFSLRTMPCSVLVEAAGSAPRPIKLQLTVDVRNLYLTQNVAEERLNLVTEDVRRQRRHQRRNNDCCEHRDSFQRCGPKRRNRPIAECAVAKGRPALPTAERSPPTAFPCGAVGRKL